MKWHNTKFMLRHMKIIVGLMTILTAVALGFVLHLASGVFIPLVIAWFLLQIFRPVLKLGDQLKLPPFLKIALVFVLLFCMTLIGVRFVASQAVEFGEVYQRFYPDLEPTIEKFTNTLMTLGFLPNSRSSVRSEEQEEEDVPRNTFILTAAASAPAEHLAEDVGEVESLCTAEPAKTAESARAAAHALFERGMTVLVVHGAFFFVGQGVVGFLNFFKFFFRLFVAGIAVGVVFHRQLAVGFFDFVVARTARHAECCIKILVAHDSNGC